MTQNRPIKFRAYLKDSNEMVKVGAMDWDYEGNLLCLNYPKGKAYFEYEDDIALMQYTGYKDKNGKEIYEGDIVEYYDDIYQVQWIWVGFYIRCIHGGFDELATTENFIEVIGNIYENPKVIVR